MILRRLVICVESSARKVLLSARRLPGDFTFRSISCWRCGREESGSSQCQVCRATFDQTKINYFELFGLPVNYDINSTDVVASYHKLQKQFHPDKHLNDIQLVQEMSKKFSMMVNRGYKTLLNPIDRGLYILSLHNVPLAVTTTADQELLTDVLEIDHDIATSRGVSLMKIQKKLSIEIDKLNVELSKAFKVKNYDDAQKFLIRMKYFQNLMQKVKNKLQSHE